MLFVYNCNPVATMPDQNRVIRGLEREDLFTVVFEQSRTDTTAFADVVLPATTFLETYDLAKAYGPLSLQLVSPVIEPYGEARPNVQVFSELSMRLGFADREEPESDAEAVLRVMSAMPDRIREELQESGIASAPCGTAPVQFVDVFPNTPDRKIDLFPAALAAEAPAGLYAFQPDPATERFPLALISPASDKTISSTLGELRGRAAALRVHPSDAATRGLEAGDTARIYNDLGEVHCLVALDEDLRPGMLSLPKGLWRMSTINGSTGNALVPDSLTDIGGGACFNDVRVEVVKILTAALDAKEIALWVAQGGSSH